ncbi:MAG: hypothetical protein WCX31_04550 [Salinivirgaceae bacterium]|jgi:hypothetical protein
MKKQTDTIRLTTPKTWNELTVSQLFFVMKYYLLDIPEQFLLINCLCKFSGIRLMKKTHWQEAKEFFKFRQGRRSFILTAEEVTVMVKELSFLLKESTLTINPMPVIKMFRRRLYGPDDNIYNITLREFIFAEMNFLSFCKSKHVTYLNNLVAILWRPQVDPYMPNSPSYGGDRRERFNDNLFARRAHKLIWLRMYKKLALFTFYSGARSALQKEFPNVFSPDNSSAGKTKNMANQMMSLVRAVNGGDPTKNEQLLDLNVREILGEMETAHERVQEFKRKHKKK